MTSYKLFLLIVFGVWVMGMVGVVSAFSIYDPFSVYSNNSTELIKHRGINYSSVDFNGISSYANTSFMLNEVINVSQNFTVDMIVSFKNITATQALFTHVINSNNRFGITISSGGIRGAFYNGSSFNYTINSQTAYNPPDKLTLITYTFNGTTSILYINRLKVATGPSTPNLGSGIGLTIGKTTSNNLFFNGSFLEISIYNDTIGDGGGKEHYNRNEILGNEGKEAIPILLYHKFSTNATFLLQNYGTTINTTNFDKQLSFLNASGYNCISLEDYYNWTQGKFTMPNRPFIIYIDDGDVTTYTEGMPIIKKYNFKATTAIITSLINTTGYMDSSQIINLSSTYNNWTISSHTVTHRRVTTLSESEIITELNQSKEDLKALLGKYPISFIYPNNDKNITTNNLCSQFYTICGANGSDSATPEYTRINANLTHDGLQRISLGFNNSELRHVFSVVQIYPKPFISWRMWNSSNIVGNNVTNSLNTGSYNLTLFNVTIINHYKDNFTFLNLDNALIYYYTNNTLVQPLLKSGNYSLYFNSSDLVLSLDQFSLIEGTTRLYSPLTFSSSTPTEKHIASTLSQMVNVTVVLSVPTCKLSSLRYVSDTGRYNLTYTRSQIEANCVNKQLTLTNIPIEPAVASNVFYLTSLVGSYNYFGTTIEFIQDLLPIAAIMLIYIFITLIWRQKMDARRGIGILIGILIILYAFDLLFSGIIAATGA